MCIYTYTYCNTVIVQKEAVGSLALSPFLKHVNLYD